MAEQIAADIAGSVVKSLMARIMKHVRYLTSCTTYVTKMRTRMNVLSNTSVDVRNRAEGNRTNYKEVPAHVPGWLDEVEKIKEDVDNIRVDGCLNLKTMYKAGKKACKITQEIDRLIQENEKIVWTDHPIALGRVISKKSSSSSDKHNNFVSRDLVFNKALEALKPDHKTSMIALCGMGGVGKSTMMKQLRETVKDQKMFDWVFTAVIGEKSSLFDVQQAIADHMSEPLTAMTETTRADQLCKRFNAIFESKKKILVILDDVWTAINLENIGLSPLPNQDVGIKFLLTSRNKDVCTKMGVEADSIFNVRVLSDPEAQNFFQQEVKISSDADPELHQIGEKIVSKCGGLPIAIKTVALNLKGKAKGVWNDALVHLEQHDLDGSVNVDEIFRMSFKSLKEEAKAIFLLCGLFPDDFDIRTEDLTRYGWGLKLFNKVYTIRDARNRLITCVEELLSANLLIESDLVGCIKMHDLVHAFALNVVSEGEQAGSVNHGNTSKWTMDQAGESCKRLSLTCTGMLELFPGDFSFPDLELLMLLHGHRSLTFATNFYEKMKKLQVIAFGNMLFPSLPGSFDCSPNLRSLCLHSCYVDDISSIGNLTNLEILSFAHCKVRTLPSTIGKLKRLKVLDVTGCINLRIDDGVLERVGPARRALYESLSPTGD